MSSHTIYYGEPKNNASFNSQNSALRSVPNQPTYNIDRFIGRGEQTASPQRQSTSSERANVESRAIAARQAKASRALQEFETRFNNPSRPPKQ
ncbi:hypothetical protein ACQKWADRAFT_309271 [Trichoderma austrokoningii]